MTYVPRPLTTHLLAVCLLGLLATAGCRQEADPLPSWQEGATKDAILDFVARTTTAGGPDYLEPAARIAVFDNDGCLWSEQPIYFQLQFAMDRVRAMAPQHPEWAGQQPYQAALDGDLEAVAAGGLEVVLELVMASHAGTDTETFRRQVGDWLETARHPRFDRPYTELVYQPMLELLDHLRAHGYRTWIVTGGGLDFVRAFAEETYGIPPEQVVGSRIETAWELTADGPRIVRRPELAFVNDKGGKPLGIHTHIGRRPVAAFGNSDGDLAMLQWTTAGAGPRLGLLVHHTDAEREWAYDRDSHIGRLDKALDEASARGWLVADMKRDWRTIHPPVR